MRSLDDLRAENPTLGFAVYAYRPRAPVVLEIHDEDGNVFAFEGDTLAECIAAAFPEEPPTPVAAATVFD